MQSQRNVNQGRMIKFEDKISEIDDLLVRNRSRWQLDSLAHIGYEDICQIIRIHIYKKWDKWDQNKAFKPWCSTVIKNQIINKVRDFYGNFKRPCLDCEHNLGGNLCAFTESGKQETSCPILEKWSKKKIYADGLRSALQIEDYYDYNTCDLQDQLNQEELAEKVHKLMIGYLMGRDLQIYKWLYIKGLSDEVVAEKCGFTIDRSYKSQNRNGRFKQLENKKAELLALAKKLIERNGLFH